MLLLEHPVHIGRGQARAVRDVLLGERHGNRTIQGKPALVNATIELREQVGAARQGGPPTDVDLPLVPDCSVAQGHQEQRGREARKLALRPLKALNRQWRDGAVRQRRRRVQRIPECKTLNPNDVTWQAKVQDLAIAVAQELGLEEPSGRQYEEIPARPRLRDQLAPGLNLLGLRGERMKVRPLLRFQGEQARERVSQSRRIKGQVIRGRHIRQPLVVWNSEVCD